MEQRLVQEVAMPAANAKNIREWFSDFFKHEGIDAAYASKQLAGYLKGAGNHEQIDEALGYADGLLEGYGVEPIRGDWVDNYYGDIVALYVNTGDTYNPTILYDVNAGKFLVTSWGDWVERYGDRYGVQ
jgi:hypothetical protein